MEQIIDKLIDPSVEMMEKEILGKILDWLKLSLTKGLQGNEELEMVEIIKQLITSNNIEEILQLAKMMIMEAHLSRKEEQLMIHEAKAQKLEDRSVVETLRYNFNNNNH